MKALPVILLSWLLLAGCGRDRGERKDETPVKRAPDAVAREVFNQNCTTCHGVSGRGDGPAAASLQPRPRDYTDPIWQSGTTDDQIRKVILEGGAAVGKSPAMMAWGKLPELQDPAVVDALVHIIRGFAKQ
ncbi:MAG TPA: c-type cytochrome [Kofleriaceae bacterium]|jgi:mono/diheme cytochrome c family protein|nr:c-type cytochrome [Kofleriaceae bacterium]